MDLFVVNRYIVADEAAIDPNEEQHLDHFLAKIQERKLVRDDLQVSCDDKLEIRHGKNKSDNKRAHEYENIISSAVPNEQEEVGYCFKQPFEDGEKVGASEKCLQSHQNIEGFMVIGKENFHKKEKVKCVLPNWLAKPSVVSTDLKNLKVTIYDIPGLDSCLIRKLEENGITHFFPVQTQLIPWLLCCHSKAYQFWPNDVCVSAPTGSGKTLSYVIPIVQCLLQRVVTHVRALVILPVQDLAVQVFKVFLTYCAGTGLRVALLTGQNSFAKEQKQIIRSSAVTGLQTLVDIIIATPGRLVDHLKLTAGFTLKHLKFLVIDEADRFLESNHNDWLYHINKEINLGTTLGNGPAPLTVHSIHSLAHPPQKLLFSATLSQDPEKLRQLGLFQPKLFTSVVGKASDMPNEDVRGDFIGKYTTPAEMREICYVVNLETKPLVLYYLITSNNWKHVLCFTNSQQNAHRLAILLGHLGRNQFTVTEISSLLPRQERASILQKFINGSIEILVCTDALARGMDIPGVQYVVSYDAPKYVKTYIHRIGRTARAGREGTAITLLLKNQHKSFKEMLKEAEKYGVEESSVKEEDINNLSELYKCAVEEMKKDIQVEKKTSINRVRELKYSRPKLGKLKLDKSLKKRRDRSSNIY